MESKIVRIKNNTDCRRRVEYLHRAYNVLLDPERKAKWESQPIEEGSARRIADSLFSITKCLHPYVP